MAEASPRQDADERIALLNSILESRTFAKSSKLAQFLKYICIQSIEGNAREINEQQIGIHVFARSPMYSASDDSIVRSQARLLRQRLEQYFDEEAPSSPLIITIPKGGYVPVFERRVVSQANQIRETVPLTVIDAAVPVEAVTGTKELKIARRHFKLLRISAVAAAAFLLLAVVLYLSFVKGRAHTAANALWQRIFNEQRPVVVITSDDALVLYEEVTHTQVGIEEYLSGSYLATATPPRLDSTPLTSEWFTDHQYTSATDLKLTMRIGRLPEAINATVKARNSRSLRVDDLKGHNVIMIGGLGANPWVGLFSDRLNFEVGYDWKNSVGYVLNKHPGKGEAAIYRDGVVGGSKHNYGVLAFLPGIQGEGEALLFEGTGMAGTESAADFPFDTAAFSAFARKIGATPYHMPYFEVLLDTTSVDGNAPEVNAVAYHLIQAKN